MSAALRKQIFRSRQAQSGNKRIELTLTPEEQKLLGPRPARTIKWLVQRYADAVLTPPNATLERWITTKELAEEFPRPAKAELEKAK